MNEHRNRRLSEAVRSIARRGVGVFGVGLLALLPACSPVEPAESTGSSREALASWNGLAANGLTMNGLTMNGLTMNGLTMNGLDTQAFNDWFMSNPVNYSDMLMRYVTACALQRGRFLWYVDAEGHSHLWLGNLGLTPDWANGRPITEPEEQLITACLAAHVNKFGLHVSLSVLGEDAHDRAVRLDSGELQTFGEPEGCFFGNLFRNEGIFSGSDRPLNPEESSVRACGLSSQSAVAQECLPMVHVGKCQSLCTKDKNSPYYDRCRFNGKEYRVLTTRLRAQDIYRCGDGECQFTENCGTGHRYDSCRADCGACATPR